MQNTQNGDTHSKKEPKKHSKWTMRKKIIVISSSVLGFLVLFSAGFVFFFISKINYKPIDEFGTASEIPTDEVDAPIESSETVDSMYYASGDILADTKIQNILLIGSDTRGGSGYGRSDTMILLSIDKKNNRIIMTSFLRDLYVKIEGVKDNRINVAYRFGGPKLLIETIQNNFRIKIDNYAQVDFETFRQVIDAVGGIGITLTSAEASELNNNSSRYSDGGGTLQKVSAGYNNLDGATALAFARIRHIDSDFQRTRRQRDVINAIVAKLKDSSAGTILGIANRFLSQIQTDLTYAQITGLIMESGTLMCYPISELSIPVAGAYRNATVRGMKVLLPDVEKNKAAIWALIYNK